MFFAVRLIRILPEKLQGQVPAVLVSLLSPRKIASECGPSLCPFQPGLSQKNMDTQQQPRPRLLCGRVKDLERISCLRIRHQGLYSQASTGNISLQVQFATLQTSRRGWSRTWLLVQMRLLSVLDQSKISQKKQISHQTTLQKYLQGVYR